MLHHTSEAQVIIRFVPGITFLPEGTQKFLYPDDLGVGRFIAIGISKAGFWAVWQHLSLLDRAVCSRQSDLGNGLLRAIARLCSFIVCVWAFTENDFNAEAL